MDLVRYTHQINEERDPSAKFPTADEILDVLKLHLNKKQNLGELHELRNKLLVAARQLLRNTIKLNALVDRPDFDLVMAKVTGLKKLRGYWASRLLSVPLLKSAVDQMATAQTGPQLALAIARLTGVVENAEDEIPAPTKTFLDSGDDSYNSIYKYLTKIEGWAAPRVEEFNGALRTLRDRLVQQAAARIAAGKPTKAPRPAGW
jgi:hypothetical protein